MNPSIRKLRTHLAWLVAALALTGACGGGDATVDRLFLRVTADASSPRVDSLRFLLAKDGARWPAAADAEAANFDLADLDPSVEPVLIAIGYNGTTFGDGRGVRVSVAGLAQGGLVARFEGQVDLADAVVVDVALKSLATACDADADGFPDCALAGCCDGASDFTDCAPDSATANPWGTEPACRACGDATDYDCNGDIPTCNDRDSDGDADCEEEACGSADDPTKGPTVAEICDGKDNDCDDIADNNGASAACPSGVCRDGACAEPSCDDDVKNGDETGVDCGGSCTGLCLVGEGCADGADCQSGVCGTDNLCAEPACDDNQLNGRETDVDCGGPCEPCANGDTCSINDDCQSDLCFETMCRPAACGDGFVTGIEGCDDGALVNDQPTPPVGGDGCSANCTVEEGWNCEVPVGGTASQCETDCGDGIIAGAEICDDGDEAPGDGCSDVCAPEPGWICETPVGGGPSECTFSDAVPPDAPVIESLTVGGVDVRGGLTRGPVLVIGGTAEARSTVRVRQGTGVLLTTQATQDGMWSGELSLLADGLYTLIATATDAASNESPGSDPITVTIDATPPAIAINTPAITNDNTPPITGTGETGASVSVTIAGATWVTTITAGTWSIDTAATPTSGSFTPNVNGANTVTATATDAAGNVGTATPVELVIDTTPPTITITAVAGDNIVNIAEVASGATATGTTTGVASGGVVTFGLNGRTYTASVAENAWTINLPAGDLALLQNGQVYPATADVSDPAGNPATRATLEVSVDRSAPTISISAVSGNDVINRGEAQNGINVAGTTTGVQNGRVVTVVFGSTTKTGTVNNNGWTTSFTEAEINAAGQGLVTITANVSDLAGNPAPQATRSITIDTVRPTVESVAFSRALVNAMTGTNTAVVTITFSEPVTDFTGADLTLRLTPTGGSATIEAYDWTDLAVVAGNNRAWTATLNPRVNFTGTARVTVGTGFADANGNGPTASFESGALNIDTQRPTVTVVFSKSQVIRNDTATVTFTFSEAPKTFGAAQIAVTNGTLGTPTVDPANPLRYTATFTPTAGLEAGTKGSVQVTTALVDVNDNTMASAVTAEINVDTLAPTVAINVAAADDWINAVEHSQQLTISGTATGADGQTVTVTLRGPGEPGNLVPTDTATVSAGTWSLNITGSLVSGLAEGTYTLRANVSDAAGNAATEASRAFTVDITPPTITANTFAGDNLVNASEATTGVVLSGATTGAQDGRTVTVTLNDSVLGTATVSNGAWERSITPANLAALGEGAHSFSLTVSDLAGNPAVAATRGFTLDRVAPTLAVSYEAVGGGALSRLRIDETGVVVFAFSEAVLGFERADVQLSWTPTIPAPTSPLGDIVATQTVGRYTATLTAPSSYTGAVVATSGSGFTDVAGNPAGTITAGASLPVDTVRPTATVNFVLPGQPNPTLLKVGDVATIVLTFSEDPSDLSVADLTPVNGALGPLVVEPGNARVWSATFTPTAGVEGTASVTLGTGWTDLGGNPPSATAQASIAVDTAPPVLTINHLATTTTWNGATVSLINASVAAVAVTFTGTVTGLESGRVPTLTLNGADYTATRDGTNWSVAVPQQVVAALPQGFTQVSVNASDANGNAATTATLGLLVLTQPPTVGIAFSTNSILAGLTTTATLTFSTIPFDFNESDIRAVYTPTGGGGQTELTPAPSDLVVDPTNPARYTLTLQPPAGYTGTMFVRVGTQWRDTAQNNPSGATSSSVIPVDTLRPTVTLSATPTTVNRAGRATTISISASELMAPLTTQLLEVRNAQGTLVPAVGTFTNLIPNPAGIEGQAWLVTFTSITDEELTVQIGVASSWTDVAGNTASSITAASVVIDTIAPTVAIATIGTNDRIGIAGQASDLIVDATIGGATGTPVVTLLPGVGSVPVLQVYVPVRINGVGVEPAVWRITIPGSDVEKINADIVNTLRVAATDAGGNTTTTDRTFVKDITRPTVAVTWTTTPTIAIGTERVVTFDFSESVTGFDLTDTTVTHAGSGDVIYAGNIFLSGLTQDVADATIWRATLRVPADVTGPPDYLALSGTLTVGVGTTLTDIAGNAPAAAASSAAANVDTVRPTATFDLSVRAVSEGTPSATVFITLSEAGTGLTLDDLSVTAGAGTLSGFVAQVGGNPLRYEATFTRDADFSGTATITLRALNQDGSAAWTDAVGNGPRNDATTTIGVNLPAPPAPTVTTATYTEGATNHVISGTFVSQAGGAFRVVITRTGFTTREYVLGTSYTDVTFVTNTSVTPNTWTLTLTNTAKLPRSTGDANGPYLVTATVTNAAALSTSGTGNITITNNGGQWVGQIFDGRPHGADAMPDWRQATPAGRRTDIGSSNGWTSWRPELPLLGGAALLGHVVEADADEDGLPDELEAQLGLDPNSIDSNGDGIEDGHEDSDDDGVANLDELDDGTDPAASESEDVAEPIVDAESQETDEGCAGGSAGGLWWLGAAAMMAWRRRRSAA
jgi:cysteine-rich repeat protein